MKICIKRNGYTFMGCDSIRISFLLLLKSAVYLMNEFTNRKQNGIKKKCFSCPQTYLPGKQSWKDVPLDAPNQQPA